MAYSSLSQRGTVIRWLLLVFLFVSISCGGARFSPSRAADFEPILKGKSPVHPTRLLAKYKDAAGLASRSVVLEPLGLAIRHQFQLVPGLVVLDTTGSDVSEGRMKIATSSEDPVKLLLERIRTLEQSELFEYVQPSYIYTNLLVPNDRSFTDGTLWGLRNTGANGGTLGADVGAVAAWDLTTGSTNVIVAVVDSGLRYSHQELVQQMWHNPGEVAGNGLDDDGDGWVDDVFGFNAFARNGDPFDDNDHGSHVAGIIGAAANDGFPHVGVAWQLQLMACKFLGADGFGTSDDAIASIDFAVQHGARVINASWAGGTFERALFDSLSAARRAGVLFVAAAGNDFSDNDATPVYPASYGLDNIISVAAMDRYDHLASFSNFGRTSVHLGAPGDSIFSCTALSDNSYDTFSGTSMAAPHVTGVAALILALFPNASVPELRERLLSTVVQVPELADKTATGGRVNAYRALSAAPDGVLELAFDPPPESDLSARRPVSFFVTVTDLSGVTNATVQARLAGETSDILFQNDGVKPDFKGLDEVYSGALTLPTVPGAFTIIFRISAPGKASITRTLNYNIVSPPLNDNFIDSLDIPAKGDFILWTNRFATIELGEPKHAQVPSASGSVWWSWTPDADTPVIVDTAGSSFDTVLGVYTNATLSTLKEVASADDAGSHKQGYVLFNARAGLQYHIAVAGFSAADTGSIRLRVEPGGGPDTNSPQAVILSPVSGLVLTNAADPKVLIAGTATDLAPNASGIQQVQVQVNRDVASAATGTTNWSSTVLLREGLNRIKVIATDYAGNASPTSSIIVTYQPIISPNDDITNAIPLLAGGGATSGNNSRASKEPGEPQHAGNSGGKSIWWSYRPQVDGLLTLNTANSTFNTLLALYTAKTVRVTDLEPIGSNDDSVPNADFSKLSEPVKSGETYFVAVDGFNGSTGLIQLVYTFTPALLHQLTIDASPGGSVSPQTAYYEADSSVVVNAIANPYFFFDRWEGSVSTTENPLSLLMVKDMVLIPRFRPIEFTDGFETGDFMNLGWKSSGNLPWIVQTNLVQSGRFAARSGAIGNGQKTSLLLTAVCREGTGSFGIRVSSEPTWDVLAFYVNGQKLTSWSGEVDWTNYAFALVAGTNTLEWRYSKDHLNSIGLDGAAIDSLDLPLLVPPNGSSRPRLDLQRFKSGVTQLFLTGQTNQSYLIEGSADLREWQPVMTNVAWGGSIRWEAPLSKAASNCFYRALIP